MLNRLSKQIAEIEKHIANGDLGAQKVSKVSTYWHLDHALNVINGITDTLEQSDPEDHKPKRSFLKTMIMTFGTMPRGKGKAPERTISKTEITREQLEKSHEKAVESLVRLKELDSNKTFKHPLFGWMQKRDTVKFIGIHTHHHLKIVRDITKSL